MVFPVLTLKPGITRFIDKINPVIYGEKMSENLVHLFNEIGMLAHTPRSGFAFLGRGSQSVAEHSHRMTLIAYVLADECKQSIDLTKLLVMCLCHDLPEARTGDLNCMNKKYVSADESKVIEELKSKHPIGKKIGTYLNEYIECKTLEAHLAHDADQLELLLKLKELSELGNPRAMEWFEGCVKRLYTETAKALAKTIRATRSDAWMNH